MYICQKSRCEAFWDVETQHKSNTCCMRKLLEKNQTRGTETAMSTETRNCSNTSLLCAGKIAIKPMHFKIKYRVGKKWDKTACRHSLLIEHHLKPMFLIDANIFALVISLSRIMVVCFSWFHTDGVAKRVKRPQYFGVKLQPPEFSGITSKTHDSLNCKPDPCGTKTFLHQPLL